jgi:hypothetical protein
VGARKLDDDAAFAFYVGMGIKRSYHAVARQFKVTPRAIRKASKRGDWMARLARIEQEAQEQSDRKLAESRAQVRDRHLKMLRAVSSRAIEALQIHRLDDAMEAVKAVEMVVKMERMILGEPNERIGFSVEEVTRRELETFLTMSDAPETDDAAEEPAPEDKDVPLPG